MKRASCLIATILLTSPPALAAGSHDHNHAHEKQVQRDGLDLNKGKKWETDSPLREGMGRIRAAFATHAEKIHNGNLPTGSFAKLAEETQAATNFIFKNCKLKPEADAALHVLLARILEGRSGMLMAEKKEKIAGARKVLGALEDYPRYFHHPGWRQLPQY